MPKYCVYCGSSVKDSDRFCIVCGKPLLSDLPGGDKNPEDTLDEVMEEDTDKKGKNEKDEIEEDDSEESIDTDDMKIEREIKPLSEEIKVQVGLHIDLNEIKDKKRLLSDKLKEFEKEMKAPEFNTNPDFKKKLLEKIDAAKTITKELNEKQIQLETPMEKPFIVTKLKNEINKKIYQLKNLVKEFKLKKIKKEVFSELKERYKKEKVELDADLHDISTGLEMWKNEIKGDKREQEHERRVNRGRYRSKEISDEEFNRTDKEYENKIKKMDLMINTIDDLLK